MDAKRIVRLDPNDEAKLHPVALRRLLQWEDKLSKQVPLSNLSLDDLEIWLTKDELAEWEKGVEGMRQWLVKCLREKAWQDTPHEGEPIIERVNQFSETLKRYFIYEADWVNDSMKQIEMLLKQVWQRKLQWFQEKQAQKEAERKSVEYAKELNKAITEFRSRLSEKRRPVRWPKEAPACYMGYSLPSSQKAKYERAATEWIEALIPKDLRQFITFDKYWLHYRLVPWAQYKLNNVPCLDFCFSVFVTIEVELWLKPAEVLIDGFRFSMPQIQRLVTTPQGEVVGGYLVLLTTPQLLGYEYLLLTPNELQLNDLGYSFWQVIPCLLLEGLMQGNAEPEGCVITEARENWTTYRAEGFDEEVQISDDLAKYFKDVGSWDSLAAKGVIDPKLVPIIQRALERAKAPKPQATGKEDVVNALVALGWTKSEAEEKIANVQFPDGLSLEDKIKLILHNT
jgi:hypothetical protein